MNINREEMLRRLNSPGNLANTLSQPSSVPASGGVASIEHVEGSRGTPHRGVEVPDATRDAIARVALEGRVPQRVIAEKFGVAQQTVSAYKTNHIGGRPPSSDRKRQHEERVQEVRDTALTKLMATLGLVDNAKLENLEAKDLGKFAKDMASVYNSLTPRDANTGNVPINLIVYSPELKTESRYKVVDVD